MPLHHAHLGPPPQAKLGARSRRNGPPGGVAPLVGARPRAVSADGMPPEHAQQRGLHDVRREDAGRGGERKVGALPTPRAVEERVVAPARIRDAALDGAEACEEQVDERVERPRVLPEVGEDGRAQDAGRREQVEGAERVVRRAEEGEGRVGRVQREDGPQHGRARGGGGARRRRSDEEREAPQHARPENDRTGHERALVGLERRPEGSEGFHVGDADLRVWTCRIR